MHEFQSDRFCWSGDKFRWQMRRSMAYHVSRDSEFSRGIVVFGTRTSSDSGKVACRRHGAIVVAAAVVAILCSVGSSAQASCGDYLFTRDHLPIGTTDIQDFRFADGHDSAPGAAGLPGAGNFANRSQEPARPCQGPECRQAPDAPPSSPSVPSQLRGEDARGLLSASAWQRFGRSEDSLCLAAVKPHAVPGFPTQPEIPPES